jgi:hypothetical protein
MKNNFFLNNKYIGIEHNEKKRWQLPGKDPQINLQKQFILLGNSMLFMIIALIVTPVNSYENMVLIN